METRDSRLGGRYRVVSTLGSGGMATVFLCEDDRLGRRVAVKRLHAHSPEETARRFVREARLGASLNHPNIVSVYDTVTDEHGVLIVMELVEGQNLADALRKGPLQTERALSVIRDVAAALDHAHGHGVIHRDIKPANVLLRTDGLTKLVDLGIATAADQTKITRSGIVLGTAAYMAPEQIEGGETGPHTDIYSLAVVAYEVLSGKRARSGRTPMEIAHQVATEGPPDLQEVWAEAPPGAAAALCRAMDKNPSERPQSAGELADELDSALQEAGDTKPTRRATGAAAGGAAGAAAGAAARADDAPAIGRDGAPDADPTFTPTARHGGRPDPARQPRPAPAAKPRPAAAGAATPARAGRRPWLAVAMAALLLALAVIVGAVALSSGGDEEKSAKSGAEREQPQGAKKKQQEEQPAAETQQAAPAPTAGGNDPARGRQLNDQGKRLIDQGDYGQAVPILKRSVESFPAGTNDISYAYALFNYGHALRKAGRAKEAVPVLQQRLKIPNQTETVRRELEAAKREAG